MTASAPIIIETGGNEHSFDTNEAASSFIDALIAEGRDWSMPLTPADTPLTDEDRQAWAEDMAATHRPAMRWAA